jgi:hypothetical protein
MAILGTAACAGEGEVATAARSSEPSEVFLGQSFGSPDHPSYPKEWRVPNLSAATKGEANVTFYMPSTPETKAELITDVFVLPGGAIAVDFPAASEPSKPVAQNYIEVYESSWDKSVDPYSYYEKDLKEAPSPAKSIVTIEGIPALAVEAHSPKDVTGDNPAFLRFVVGGTEVQLSGGEDMHLLESIATSIIDEAKTSSAEP